jgi:DNA-binding SARP family transcriptional activator/tetratricopeptide (TPR) repeat protein
MVRFQLLGHVAAQSEHGPVPLGTARQRAVLAALLVEPGVPVALDQLVERVWGTTPPRSARQTLHSYISRLRRVLGDTGGPAPVRRSGGYALDVDAAAVDLHRFRALVTRARCADDGHAVALWQDAMALWRGRPFADLDSSWLRSVAVTLEAEHQAACLEHFDLLLRRGEHARLLPEMAAAAEAHPLDERLAGQLMLALYRCGRQSDALAHFRLVQERLADELGSDPGSALRDLHHRILRHDPGLAAPTVIAVLAPAGPSSLPADGAAGGTSPDVVPHPARPSHRPAQLPHDVAGFTGRSDDLRRLDELLPDVADDHAARAVVITAIGGTAGVGKTALAVHWAHRVADRFPDGQLYVNLRGYDPEQPMRPTDALARFLTVLGVPERDIPLDEDERAAQYRSELAGRRMLIVLDNAGTVAQVRPLLPGSGTSFVLVTSRDSLAGLAAVQGAHQVGLDLLPVAEAVDLLHRLIGERVMVEPEAAVTLVEQCARLPLALRVAAVLATSRPGTPLVDVVAELADRQERLELLDAGGDPYAAVHAVFSWSIQHLSEPAARTFRLLGLHPGPDLDQYVAAALTGLAPNAARRVLETLVSAHLLQRAGRDRYGMHDLLRAYAARLATTVDAEHERRASERRLLDYYQSAAYAAVNSLYPAEVPYQPDEAPDIPVPDLTEPASARGWLRAERSCLVAVAEHAADRGDNRYVVGLALILHRYVNSTQPVDLFVVNAHALRAAEAAGDLAGQAQIMRLLGVGHSQAGRYETALEHFHRALALFQQSGDLAGEAYTLTNLAAVDHRRGDHKVAREGHYRALAVAQRAGDRFVEASVRNNVAGVEAGLGNIDAAYETCRQALATFQDIGARYCEAIALNNLANTEIERGDYTTAAGRLRRSLATAEALGIVTMRAYVLDSLGMLHLHLEEPDDAAAYFAQALAVCRETGDVSGQAWSFNGLGEAATLAGRAAEALRSHTGALGIAVQVGARGQQARAHAGVGHAHHSLGDADLARTHYERACALYTELGMPEAEELRARLEAASAV